MEDKTIVCVDCQQPFVFTAGEQQFYAERGLLELPKRCKPCRGQRRRRLSRRRKPGAEKVEIAAAEQAEALVEAPPASSAPKEKHAPAGGPRTFWDERPEWVRQAMLKAVTPTVPAAHPENGNGAASSHEAHEQVAARASEEQRSPAAPLAALEEPRKRRRRRSRRRRRRGSEETVGAHDGSADPEVPEVEATTD